MFKKLLFYSMLFFLPQNYKIYSGFDAPSLFEHAVFSLAHSLKNASAQRLIDTYYSLPEDLKPLLAQTIIDAHPELVAFLHTQFNISAQLTCIYQAQHDFDGGPSNYTMTAISPTGRYYAYVKYDGSINLVDIQTGSFSQFSFTQSPAIGALCFSFDDRYLAVGVDKKVQIIDIEEGFPIASFSCNQNISALLFNKHDSNLLYIGSQDCTLRLGDISANKASVIGKHNDAITGLTLHPHQPLLASCSLEATIKIWDTVTHKELYSTHKLAHVQNLMFDATGKHLYLYSDFHYCRINLWPCFSASNTYPLALATLRQSYTSDYALVKDDKSVRLIHIPTNTLLQKIDNTSYFKSCAFSSCGHYAIVVTVSEQVSIYKFTVPLVTLELALIALYFAHNKAPTNSDLNLIDLLSKNLPAPAQNAIHVYKTQHQ